MSTQLSSGAEDTRAEFEGKPPSFDYPRSFRRAVAQGRWERAAWLEARTAERWLSRLGRMNSYGPIVRSSRVCACGAQPDGSESHGTGDYIADDGQHAWICLACWCAENYGNGAIETLEARRDVLRRGAADS